MPRIEKTIAEFVGDQDLPAVAPDASVSAAIDVMRSRRCDCVVVLRERKPEGIFTERDFLNRVAATSRNPATTKIADVMTAAPAILQRSDCVSYAINRMAHGGFRNIPIVDERGHALAVLSVRDVMSHLADVFAELDGVEREGDWAEWTDMGGG